LNSPPRDGSNDALLPGGHAEIDLLTAADDTIYICQGATSGVFRKEFSSGIERYRPVKQGLNPKQRMGETRGDPARGKSATGRFWFSDHRMLEKA
jgi:hypothetical protein